MAARPTVSSDSDGDDLKNFASPDVMAFLMKNEDFGDKPLDLSALGKFSVADREVLAAIHSDLVNEDNGMDLVGDVDEEFTKNVESIWNEIKSGKISAIRAGEIAQELHAGPEGFLAREDTAKLAQIYCKIMPAIPEGDKDSALKAMGTHLATAAMSMKFSLPKDVMASILSTVGDVLDGSTSEDAPIVHTALFVLGSLPEFKQQPGSYDNITVKNLSSLTACANYLVTVVEADCTEEEARESLNNWMGFIHSALCAFPKDEWAGDQFHCYGMCLSSAVAHGECECNLCMEPRHATAELAALWGGANIAARLAEAGGAGVIGRLLLMDGAEDEDEDEADMIPMQAVSALYAMMISDTKMSNGEYPIGRALADGGDALVTAAIRGVDDDDDFEGSFARAALTGAALVAPSLLNGKCPVAEAVARVPLIRKPQEAANGLLVVASLAPAPLPWSSREVATALDVIVARAQGEQAPEDVGFAVLEALAAAGALGVRFGWTGATAREIPSSEIAAAVLAKKGELEKLVSRARAFYPSCKFTKELARKCGMGNASKQHPTNSEKTKKQQDTSARGAAATVPPATTPSVPSDTILEKIRAIKGEHADYGVKSVLGALRSEGLEVSEKRVKKLMKENGLMCT